MQKSVTRVQITTKISEVKTKTTGGQPIYFEDHRRSCETFRRLPKSTRNLPKIARTLPKTISGDLRRSPDIFEAFPSFRRSKAIPFVYLSSKCMVRGFKLSIFSSVLLISNHMIFLVQFGINKHL